MAKLSGNSLIWTPQSGKTIGIVIVGSGKKLFFYRKKYGVNS